MSTAVRRPSAADGASGIFECNICLEELCEPVLTPCGHLYCWSCLFRWLAMTDHGTAGACPVCQAGVSADDVIPVYGRPARNVGTESRRANCHAQHSVARKRCDSAGERSSERGGDSDSRSRAEPPIPCRPPARRPVHTRAARSMRASSRTTRHL